MYHERLDVYKCSIKFLEISTRIINKLDKSNYIIKDQLKRASFSISLNIAEGSGKVELYG